MTTEGGLHNDQGMSAIKEWSSGEDVVFISASNGNSRAAFSSAGKAI
jgi:hypothetical protein